ncbi:MAG: hypothetical protein MI746_01480, partial [Pseudomonadales bacterium]|nr:hypothetical protein [Pseudomonadales bacterium]
MSFQVTQCPSCASTFNTNPKLLDMAEGRVRCGACLTVFDAVDHFVSSDLADQEQSDESVFIGSEPEDFFDPSVFLTRSALNQPDDELVTTESEEEPEQSAQSEFSDFIPTEEIHSEDLFAREAPEIPPELAETSADFNKPESDPGQLEPLSETDKQTDEQEDRIELIEPNFDATRIQGFESAFEDGLKEPVEEPADHSDVEQQERLED